VAYFSSQGSYAAARESGRSRAAFTGAPTHIFDWSLDDVEREVKASWLYRQLARVGAGTVPDQKTLARPALALGPEVLGQMHRRLVAIAREHKITPGRKLRVDTTMAYVSRGPPGPVT